MSRSIAASLMSAAVLSVGSEVRNGGVIFYTQSSLNLEQLLGKFAFATD